MGLTAGYFRGWVDTVVSRLIEIVMVFPFLLFIVALDVVAGPQLNAITFGFLAHGVFTLALIFSIFGWFYPARIIRGVVLSLREKEFVEAARMTGASDYRIMRSHLLPHLVAPIIVYSTLIIASNILAEAGLSFLGLGIQQPTASWGNLLEGATQYYLTQPWLMVWPGLCDPAHDPRIQPARRRSAGCVRSPRTRLEEGPRRGCEGGNLTNSRRSRHTSHAGVFLVTTLLPCGAARQGRGVRLEEEEGVICAGSRCSPCSCSSWE